MSSSAPDLMTNEASYSFTLTPRVFQMLDGAETAPPAQPYPWAIGRPRQPSPWPGSSARGVWL
jgi:hypothetical protein